MIRIKLGVFVVDLYRVGKHPFQHVIDKLNSIDNEFCYSGPVNFLYEDKNSHLKVQSEYINSLKGFEKGYALWWVMCQ